MGCTCGKGQKPPKTQIPQHILNGVLQQDHQEIEDAYRFGGGSNAIDWEALEREVKGENLR